MRRDNVTTRSRKSARVAVRRRRTARADWTSVRVAPGRPHRPPGDTAIAPQSAGVAQPKVAVSTAVGRRLPASHPATPPATTRPGTRTLAGTLGPHLRRQRRAAHRRTRRNARAQRNGGGGEHGGVESGHPFNRQVANARGERRNRERVRSRYTRPPSSPTTMRRSSTNAAQRGGAQRGKLAIDRRM